jgi:hypothetical protein
VIIAVMNVGALTRGILNIIITDIPLYPSQWVYQSPQEFILGLTARHQKAARCNGVRRYGAHCRGHGQARPCGAMSLLRNNGEGMDLVYIEIYNTERE